MTPTMVPPPQVQRQLATRSHGGRIFLILLLLTACALGGSLWLLSTRNKTVAKATEAPGKRPWEQQIGYATPEKVVEKAAATPVDNLTPEVIQLRAEVAALKRQMEEFAKRKNQTTVINQAQPAPAVTKAPEKRPAPMLFYNKDLADKVTPVATTKEYVLAPGATKLPCTVETVINSDVPGFFTCRVSTNIWDTATGRHLLVPQGSTVLGHDQSQDLIFGNTRLPTVSLTLTLPDGRSVDLGQAPVTDQLGVAGLTGDVDNHWMRLIGAVFVGGALRGGQQAIQTAVAGAGGVGQVAAGISSVGNQVTSQRIGRALDTRPTITVHAGQLGNVLLIKPLSLPAMWE